MRRGQAALEYLTTYGWVFLVIVVSIGALAYFGFLQPSKYLPDRCTFGAQLVCVDYQVKRTPAPHEVRFRVRNNFAKPINILSVTEIDPQQQLGGCNTPLNDIAVGQVVNVSCNIIQPAQLFDGEKYSFPMRVTFERNATGAPSHTLTGEVYATSN